MTSIEMSSTEYVAILYNIIYTHLSTYIANIRNTFWARSVVLTPIEMVSNDIKYVCHCMYIYIYMYTYIYIYNYIIYIYILFMCVPRIWRTSETLTNPPRAACAASIGLSGISHRRSFLGRVEWETLRYTLVTNIAMENHHVLMGKLTINGHFQ